MRTHNNNRKSQNKIITIIIAFIIVEAIILLIGYFIFDNNNHKNDYKSETNKILDRGATESILHFWVFYHLKVYLFIMVILAIAFALGDYARPFFWGVLLWPK